jgi:hypothetical protein
MCVAPLYCYCMMGCRANRPRSYISRTTAWDEFPRGRWGDTRNPAYGSFNDHQVCSFSGDIALLDCTHLILCVNRPMMVGRVNTHGLSGSLWRTNIFARLCIIFHGAHVLFYMKLTMQDMYLSGAHEQFLRKRSRSKKMLTEWGVPLASAEVVNKVLNL